MRFDDMIATVLAGSAERPQARVAQWRQLVDLLAQRRAEGAPETRATAFAFLRAGRDAVPMAIREQSARSLVGLAVDPELVAFFAEDRATVAAPLIRSVRFSGPDWLTLLPRLGPTARALLRHRRDLPADAVRALHAFGASDFVLHGEVAAQPPESGPAEGESQIRELVERIEAYRRERERPAQEAESEPAESFRWEAGVDGAIRWVDAAARGAVVGESIAAIAEAGRHGVDGQAAGAYEKRSPFRDARLRVAGTGPLAGDWRISGVPFFEPSRGAFLGYRGSARRPRIDETAHPEAAHGGLFGPDLPPDSLRQLIHELRTPLNAIMGFAEMIEGEYLGPAAPVSRGQAGDIVGQARRLLSAVDDLDTAARIETHRLELDEGAVDAGALLARLHESYDHVARQRGAQVLLSIAAGLPQAAVAAEAAERMFGRALAATVGLAEADERLHARLNRATFEGHEMLALSLDRPRAIAGADEQALLDPGYSPEGDWPAAPVLGLGFALRLVRNLAEASGGALLIEAEAVRLLLPARIESSESKALG